MTQPTKCAWCDQAAEIERLEAEIDRLKAEIERLTEELPTLSSLRGVAPDATGDLLSEEFIALDRDSWDDV